MKIILSILLISLITACATPIPSSKEEIISQVSIGYDQYTKTTSITAKSFSVPGVDSLTDPAFAYADLRGWIDPDGSEGMNLYVFYSGSNWKFYSDAVDIDGKTLPFLGIDRRILGASDLEEKFQAVLSRDYVEKHRVTGINVKFIGKHGAMIVQMPSVYVEGFLQKFDAAHSQIAASKNTNDHISLGVQFVKVAPALAVSLKMPRAAGVLVINVAANSPAARAGIKQGDVILKFGDKEIQTLADLPASVATITGGTKVPVRVFRLGGDTEISIEF